MTVRVKCVKVSIEGCHAPKCMEVTFMSKRKIFLKLSAVCLILVMALSLVACFGNNNTDTGKTPPKKEESLSPSSIKVLADLPNYSNSASDYKGSVTITYADTTYDGKNCENQITKLQNRIDKKTEDVYFGESESAVTKIFTKSTPQGILGAIAKAGLSYDEMVRVVDYLAGEEEADVGAYVKEIKEERNGVDVTTGWSGILTTTSSKLTLWVDAGENGDLNKGWSFFDDWELYDRLKEYAKSKDTNSLTESKDVVEKAADIGTKALAEDNASWQYRSILEKVYTQVNLPGAPAARLATQMLLYAIEVSNDMASTNMGSQTTIKDAVGDKTNSSAFSSYFRHKVDVPASIPETLDGAMATWNPYEGLGDYDVLSYLLAFNDFHTNGYNNLDGVRSCAQLYGYYYLYNQTYYNVVLADRERYKNQLYYEKLDIYSNSEWADHVSIQRDNYEGSYRYKESFYQVFYKIHFDFQTRKENSEKQVYVITDVINNCTYTGEMQKAISTANNGIKGQLAMSDWLWCYGGSADNMKSYNEANTGYQKGKQGTKEQEYEGQFYYEFEELKVVRYLMENMTNTELSGALYYNCYAYSGSMVSQMQGYSKHIVLVQDGIKGYDEYTSIPESANVDAKDYNAYAIGKMKVLRDQAKNDWTNTSVDTKASNASSQPWSGMLDEIKDAQSRDYLKVKSDDTKKGDWQVRCEHLEDRVIARIYSCCDQRVSEADLNECPYNHAQNSDGTAVTKEYDTKQKISKFASDYESILLYMAAKSQVEFQKPAQGYKTNGNEAVYNVGYYGDIPALIEEVKTGTNVQKMTYKELKTFTMKSGASFEDEIASDSGEDGKWWRTNKPDSTLEGKQTGFGPENSEELKSGATLKYLYTYEFAGWFLDEACRFEFNPADNVDFSLVVYAGYKLTKAQVQ